MTLDLTPEERVRFESKIYKGPGVRGDCWLWIGTHNNWGYGFFGLRKKMLLAHRLSFYLHYGHWPTPSCLHHCDNTLCVRPSHLWEGTQADNIRDAARKKRMARGARNGAYTHPEQRPRGERHGSRMRPDRLPYGDRNGMRTHPKFDDATIIAVIRADGSLQAISARYGMSPAAISIYKRGIRRRDLWEQARR